MKYPLYILVLSIFLAGFAFLKVGKKPDDVRLKYNNKGLVVDLGVGLWANPFPMDWDNDGDTDLLVSTTDKPSNGLYLFENEGS